jgi:hypothetical protein
MKLYKIIQPAKTSALPPDILLFNDCPEPSGPSHGDATPVIKSLMEVCISSRFIDLKKLKDKTAPVFIY